MGHEASFQAIPEHCELLKRARQELEIAEMIQFFHSYVRMSAEQMRNRDAITQYFFNAARELIQLHPGLEQRYFYAGSRTFDAIIYLLSPARRNREWKTDQSLIKKAFWGLEPLLDLEAHALQGFPVAFVPTADTQTIATYLEQITREQLHEHYDPPKMVEAGVYKIGPHDDEQRFHWIWEEFVGMRDVYRAAAYNYEAVITVID